MKTSRIVGFVEMAFLTLLIFLLQVMPVKANETFTIGITQFAEHPALDAVRQGFEENFLSIYISYSSRGC
jgi:putative tryptophan/tyrosine transport system substrate-binding protein